MTANVTIQPLTQAWMESNWPRLKELSRDLAWDYWDRAHFLCELPGKWSLSLRAETAGTAAGYAIVSRKGSWLWLHHLVVAPDQRSSGLGASLLHEIETRRHGPDVKGVRLKVGCDNARARAFYERHGYQSIEAEPALATGGEAAHRSLTLPARQPAYVLYEKVLAGRAKVVAIHQPNYFPWPGYFYKMMHCDDFVFLDDALVSNNSFLNRNRIKQHSGELWLTVPTRQHLSDRICDVGYAENKWPAKHLRTLQQYYSKAAHFKAYFPALEAILKTPPPRLAELNIKLVQQIAAWLQIHCVTHLSSQLRPEGASDDRLINLVHGLRGHVYLSGKGGANYQSEDKFQQAGIRLVYHGFRPPVYPQLGKEFVPGLSILDLLFNCGPDARGIIEASGNETLQVA